MRAMHSSVRIIKEGRDRALAFIFLSSSIVLTQRHRVKYFLLFLYVSAWLKILKSWAKFVL
jgi:hypothetical protein